MSEATVLQFPRADRCEIAKGPCEAHVACELRIVIRGFPHPWKLACYRHADAVFAAIAETEAAHDHPGLWTVECRPDPILRAAMEGDPA